MSKTQPARGMRDFLPADIRKREYVIGIIKEVYESYGFEPLETPAVENLETLTGKYGEEGNQLIFKILKRGEKLGESFTSEKDLADLALRYDLTVPLARVVAQHRNDLPKFFKRYQIQPVWRADRPARGRFREFYQCDVDAIGSSSMTVEAELCAAVSEILQRLGFDDFVIRVNHRKVLMGILEVAGVPLQLQTDALVALDKIDKIGREGVTKEFAERGITDETGIKLLTFFEFFIKEKSNKFFDEEQKLNLTKFQKSLNYQDENLKRIAPIVNAVLTGKDATENQKQQVLNWIDNSKRDLANIETTLSEMVKEISSANEASSSVNKKDYKPFSFEDLVFLQKTSPLMEILKFIKTNAQGIQGVAALANTLNYLKNIAAYPYIKIDPSLARGLSYYTGAIFEINVPDLAGSLGGGGRYDGLIGMFGKEQIPACGFSLGLERILVVMNERGMFPPELETNSADVLVTIWNEESIGESLSLAKELRQQRLRVFVYPEADKLGKQFKYASQINASFVCVLGENELAENKVTLKNMLTGEQETLSRNEIAAKITSIKS